MSFIGTIMDHRQIYHAYIFFFVVSIRKKPPGFAGGLAEFDGSVVNNKSLQLVNRSKPVSYTHLRAHETLRYLVCRLLLEKKK